MFSNHYHWISSLIGLLINVSALLCFMYLEIFGASIWSAAAVVFSLANVQLNYLILKKKIATWHSIETLEPIKDLSVFGGVISSGAMVWYIFCYRYYKGYAHPDGMYMIMNAVWTLMTVKWNIFLYFTVKRCLIAVADRPPPAQPNLP